MVRLIRRIRLQYGLKSLIVFWKQIFEDESVELVFDEDTFKFSIIMDGREPFDFNTLSSGYAAILDIVVDLIIRIGKTIK